MPRPIKIASWLRRQIDNSATVVTLFRALPSGGPGAKIDAVRCESTTDPESLGDTLEDIARGECEGARQTTKFVARATHNGDTLSNFTFTMEYEGDEGSETGIVETATPTGLLQQLMRHNESLMRQNRDMLALHVQSVAQNDERVASMINTLQVMAIKGLEARASLATGEDERDVRRAEIDVQLAEIKQREELIVSAVEMIAPAIRKFVGDAVGDPNEDKN